MTTAYDPDRDPGLLASWTWEDMLPRMRAERLECLEWVKVHRARATAMSLRFADWREARATTLTKIIARVEAAATTAGEGNES